MRHDHEARKSANPLNVIQRACQISSCFGIHICPSYHDLDVESPEIFLPSIYTFCNSAAMTECILGTCPSHATSTACNRVVRNSSHILSSHPEFKIELLRGAFIGIWFTELPHRSYFLLIHSNFLESSIPQR